jgi:hypothetical protein
MTDVVLRECFADGPQHETEFVPTPTNFALSAVRRYRLPADRGDVINPRWYAIRRRQRLLKSLQRRAGVTTRRPAPMCVRSSALADLGRPA